VVVVQIFQTTLNTLAKPYHGQITVTANQIGPKKQKAQQEKR